MVSQVHENRTVHAHSVLCDNGQVSQHKKAMRKMLRFAAFLSCAFTNYSKGTEQLSQPSMERQSHQGASHRTLNGERRLEEHHVEIIAC